VIDKTDYFSFLATSMEVPFLSLLALFFLMLMRIAPIVALAPFLGGKLPSGVKIGLTLAIVAIIFPMVVFSIKPPIPGFDYFFVLYCFKELFVGFFMVFLINIPFYIVQSSGVLIDFLRGSSALQVPDPFMQSQSSSIGQLYNYIFIVVFYEVGGVFVFFSALLHSYLFIPINWFFPHIFFHLQQPFWQFILTLLTKFLSLAIQLGAPSLVAVLMAEMFLGIANRLAPQVQIAFLGMALKSLVALVLLCVGWSVIIYQLGKQSLVWLDGLNKILETLPR
jgi:type III secretion protein T